MEKYLVVLFKNKQRKRIIKKFVTFKKAKQFYDDLLRKSDEVIFDVLVENGKQCKYELGLVEKSSTQLIPVYITDELGRNIKVKMEDNGLSLFEISIFKKEELIFDIQKKEKITSDKFIKSYLKGSELKMMSVLNNKVIVQKDEEINLFSLKSAKESSRFIDCISNHFIKNRRNDCLFIKDTSAPQKKYLINLLEKNGIDKKILYRKFTTFPR